MGRADRISEEHVAGNVPLEPVVVARITDGMGCACVSPAFGGRWGRGRAAIGAAGFRAGDGASNRVIGILIEGARGRAFDRLDLEVVEVGLAEAGQAHGHGHDPVGRYPAEEDHLGELGDRDGQSGIAGLRRRSSRG